MSDNPTRLRKYSLADTIVAGAGPNAEKEATAYRVRRYVVASALVAGALYLFRRDRYGSEYMCAHAWGDATYTRVDCTG